MVIHLERIQLLWVARSHTLPKAGVKSHTHPYFHMFYVTGGNCQFIADGETYMLEPGQCLLVPPHVLHGYSNETDQLLEYLEIKFTLSKSALYSALTQDGVQFCQDPLAGALFQQVLEEYSTLGGLADDAATAYLTALLNVLTKSHRHLKTRQFRYIDASACSELSQQVIRHLEAHYAEDISLDALAQVLGYNKTYLCGAFKKNTQLTILDCLNTIRIRHAAELIVYSDHSLAQVADMCGFSSVSHFNRVFLKYVGVTPGQCRRAYPMDALIDPPDSKPLSPRPAGFMYSVLAQKQITPQMILEFNNREKNAEN